VLICPLQATSKSRRSFRLKERIQLVQAWVSDAFTSSTSSTKIPGTGFILGSPHKMYRFMAPSLNEKEVWYTEIHRHILAQKTLFSKLLTHQSIPDEVYYCAPVKAKISYLGMLKDELSFRSGEEINIIGYKDVNGKWKPGLYSTEEPFDLNPDWFVGIINDSFGWFPSHCLFHNDSKYHFDLPSDDLVIPPMFVVFNLKQRMIEITGREVPPLRDNERVAKIFTGDGVFKTLRIPIGTTIDDIVKMYFRVDVDIHSSWYLIETSSDETVQRPLDVYEDPSRVIDFWGKNRDQMKFYLRQTLMSNFTNN
jgi:hypothetical protein